MQPTLDARACAQHIVTVANRANPHYARMIAWRIMGKVGSSPAFRRNNRQNPHPPRVEVDIPVDDLVGLTPEEMARNLAPEALLELAKLVRGKGAAIRHATAKLGAIKELLSYGIAKPAQATTLSAPDGGPVRSEHTIRFVDPA